MINENKKARLKINFETSITRGTTQIAEVYNPVPPLSDSNKSYALTQPNENAYFLLLSAISALQLRSDEL